MQAATALVLLLAANTAFNGFPLLGSVLAKDHYAPKALSTRGDRLIYSNGVIILALAAASCWCVFQANVTSLIQLYIIGVFVSFTLGQTGHDPALDSAAQGESAEPAQHPDQPHDQLDRRDASPRAF